MGIKEAHKENDIPRQKGSRITMGETHRRVQGNEDQRRGGGNVNIVEDKRGTLPRRKRNHKGDLSAFNARELGDKMGGGRPRESLADWGKIKKISTSRHTTRQPEKTQGSDLANRCEGRSPRMDHEISQAKKKGPIIKKKEAHRGGKKLSGTSGIAPEGVSGGEGGGDSQGCEGKLKKKWLKGKVSEGSQVEGKKYDPKHGTTKDRGLSRKKGRNRQT